MAGSFSNEPSNNLDPTSKAEVPTSATAGRGDSPGTTRRSWTLQPDRVLLPDGLKDLYNDGYPDLIGLTGDIPGTYRCWLR
ncbi:hypothetical protein [Nonomuraea sp. NPDC049400]|uniref:hypothetical protein n=1 Tax=Nonomuraea sp. NPDC049400 TaxID=3364352 RepID=UPI00379BA0B9